MARGWSVIASAGFGVICGASCAGEGDRELAAGMTFWLELSGF
jgi:hypothetical protein